MKDLSWLKMILILGKQNSFDGVEGLLHVPMHTFDRGRYYYFE